MLGDHRHDARLGDQSAEALADEAQWAAPAGAGPGRRSTRGALTAAQQADAAILRNALELRRFEIEELRAHEWDPLRGQPRHRGLRPAGARLRAARRPAALGGRPAGRRAGAARHGPRRRWRTCPGCTWRRRSASSPAPAPCSRPSSSAPSAASPGSRRGGAGPEAALEAIDEHIDWLESRLDRRRTATRGWAPRRTPASSLSPSTPSRRRLGARPRRGPARGARGPRSPRRRPGSTTATRTAGFAGCSTGWPSTGGRRRHDRRAVRGRAWPRRPSSCARTTW